MSLQTRLASLVSAIGADIKAINVGLGLTPATVARGYPTANTALPGGWTQINCNGISFDPGGNFSGGKYVCPLTGYYQVDAQIAFNTVPPVSAGVGIGVLHNPGTVHLTGDGTVPGATGSGLQLNLADIVYCQAGDTLQLECYWPSASAWLVAGNAPTATYLSVTLVGSAQPGTASAQTVARAYRAAAYTEPISGAKVPLDTVSFDPGGNFVSSSTYGGVAGLAYRCPVTGYYQVDGQAALASATSAIQALIYKNGSSVSGGDYQAQVAGPASKVSDIIYCQAGDLLELWARCTVTGALVLSTVANFLAVVQIAGPALIGALSPVTSSGSITAQPGTCVYLTGVGPVTLPKAPVVGAVVQVVSLTAATTVFAQTGDTIKIGSLGGLASIGMATGDQATFQYLNGVWYVIDAPLQRINNLADLGSASAARTNLGLGTSAVKDITAFLQMGVAGTARVSWGLINGGAVGSVQGTAGISASSGDFTIARSSVGTYQINCAAWTGNQACFVTATDSGGVYADAKIHGISNGFIGVIIINSSVGGYYDSWFSVLVIY